MLAGVFDAFKVIHFRLIRASQDYILSWAEYLMHILILGTSSLMISLCLRHRRAISDMTNKTLGRGIMSINYSLSKTHYHNGQHSPSIKEIFISSKDDIPAALFSLKVCLNKLPITLARILKFYSLFWGVMTAYSRRRLFDLLLIVGYRYISWVGDFISRPFLSRGAACYHDVPGYPASKWNFLKQAHSFLHYCQSNWLILPTIYILYLLSFRKVIYAALTAFDINISTILISLMQSHVKHFGQSHTWYFRYRLYMLAL